MPWKWTNRFRRRYERYASNKRFYIFPRPSLSQEVRHRSKPPPRRYSSRLERSVTPYQSPLQMSPYVNTSRSASSSIFRSSTSSSTTRKLQKNRMPIPKKIPISATQPLVIGNPQKLKKSSLATNLLLRLGVSTSRTGSGGDSGAPSRPDSPGDDITSFLSSNTFTEQHGLPNHAASVVPPLVHRHTAPEMRFPNPLRANPPEPTRAAPPPPHVTELHKRTVQVPRNLLRANPPQQTRTAPPSLHAVELDGGIFQAPIDIGFYDRKNGCNGESSSASSRYGVMYGRSRSGTLSSPIIEEAEDIEVPILERSSSSDQTLLAAEHQVQDRIETICPPRSSSLPATLRATLPLEVMEPFKIWQHYAETGNIKVHICPETLDGQGRYTWVHCWDLFNIYTFATTYTNNAEFADRTMDLLCEKIKPGQAADPVTITHIFANGRFSTRLKRLVVDRCIDAGAEYLTRSVTKQLPPKFAVYALEAAIERFTDPDWVQKSQSPCRYHRHKPNDCYLQKFANERDRRVVANRKARKIRTSTQVRFDLATIKFKHSALDTSYMDESVTTAASDEERSSPPESIPESISESISESIPEDKESFQSTTSSTETASISGVQESKLATSESSVIATLDLEDDEGASIATACNIIRPSGAIALVGITDTLHPSHPEVDRFSFETAEEDRFQCGRVEDVPFLNTNSESLVLS